MPLSFDADCLPDPSLEYVAWLDVMGIQVAMSRSLPISANFIFKLHTAALQAQCENVTLYPVMDGLYASSENKEGILGFLRSVFEQIAEEFIRERKQLHRFIVRGALAYGSVIHGGNIPEQASPVMHQNDNYRMRLLLGLPIVQANTTEKLAPPFGLYVHESARESVSSQKPRTPFIWWQWRTQHKQGNVETWNSLRESLDEYFAWCSDRSDAIDYQASRIEDHRSKARQYFSQLY